MRGRLAPAEEGNGRVTKIRLSVICINGTRWVIIGEGALFAKHEWFPYEDYLLCTIYSAPPRLMPRAWWPVFVVTTSVKRVSSVDRLGKSISGRVTKVTGKRMRLTRQRTLTHSYLVSQTLDTARDAYCVVHHKRNKHVP